MKILSERTYSPIPIHPGDIFKVSYTGPATGGREVLLAAYQVEKPITVRRVCIIETTHPEYGNGLGAILFER